MSYDENTRYTVFVGLSDDDDVLSGEPVWEHLRVKGCAWPEAKKLLAERLIQVRNHMEGFCEVCWGDANDALAKLAVTSGGLFEAIIEGEDYMIIPEQP